MKEVPTDPSLLNAGWLGVPEPGEGSHPLRDKLIELVEALPEPERTVVEMVTWGRCTKAEVAVALGRSRQSVHDIWMRGLDTLRAELQDDVSVHGP